MLVDANQQDVGIVLPRAYGLSDGAEQKIEFDSDGEEMPIPGEESANSHDIVAHTKPQYIFLKDDATR